MKTVKSTATVSTLPITARPGLTRASSVSSFSRIAVSQPLYM